ncbi:MAG: SEC-C metal-binding domain-containing protein [bacterium]
MVNFKNFDMPEFEGKIFDDGKCECAICGKKKKLGGMISPTPDMEDQSHKIICIDCTLEESALRHGITKKEATERRKRVFGAFYTFQEVMLERYFKENKKKRFDSIEETNEVLDFVKGTWNRAPKEFQEIIEMFDKGELKKMFKELRFDFKTFSSLVKHRTGAKIDRNGPCPCGSGKKYKECCGR